jgi:ribosomal protein L40E
MVEEKRTKFCPNCGAEIDINAKICPKCGVEQLIVPKEVSNWWYLVPIFLGIVGGLIAWLVNKEVNPKKAKKFLIIGIALPIVYIIVMIVIISLSTLVSVGGAKQKAKETRIISDMSEIRVAAEIVYEKENSYSTVSCTHPEIVSICQDIKTQTGKEPTIYSTQKDYCAYIKLPSGDYYCVDSKSTAKKTSVYPGGTGYCDGRTFVCP